MDIILPQSEYKKLGFSGNDGKEPSIYHQWKQKVVIKVSPKLKKSIDADFSTDGLLVMHGYSNACWSPEINYVGNWTLKYRVSKGRVRADAMGRGIFE